MNNDLAPSGAAKIDDDPQFANLASAIARHLLDDAEPEFFHRVAIAGWFDHKWLGFAGKLLGAAGAWHKTQHLVLPPFHPSRVRGVRTLQRVSLDPLDYAEREPARLHVWQGSEQNFRRKIAKLDGESAVYLWRSVVPRESLASLMAYARAGGTNSAWHATFQHNGSVWKLLRCKGIPRESVEDLMRL